MKLNIIKNTKMKVVAILGQEEQFVQVLHVDINVMEYFPMQEFLAKFGVKLIEAYLLRKHADKCKMY